MSERRDAHRDGWMPAAGPQAPTRLFLGVGSNIDRERNIVRGVRALAELLGPLRLSPVYSSAALGFTGDPFLNLVAEAHTHRPLAELAAVLRELEYRFGRPLGAPRFSPRHLDVDILSYGETCGTIDGIVLPREEVLSSAFVLRPLADLAPEARHPELGLRYAQLWADMAPTAPPLQRMPGVEAALASPGSVAAPEALYLD
jgi:2-amino-4-hydroxy-6-hydroxymethyldihydropteridine diphosphokinase